VKVCPSCGRENADDARFCSGCGTSLEPERPAREERKVVTCLFCDLVGFTARAERMDPEDVRRLLQPYHARVRSELERFGGTVEKFIGDAVMAVFGAPTAHEDDPERAVRAALAIRDTLAAEGELEVRIGITTGEALIALGARPEAGEGMASGDVVNTAARLQSAAPTGSVLVDETTYRATERAIEYGETPSIGAKGKTALVPVWEALRARARVGAERVGRAELVGRDHELTLLSETLTRAKREKAIQLVTLVGVPGIGKSRLVYELFAAVEESPEIVFWRRGRSLPYGEGVTFWALSEMVKAQAGILESDSSDQAGKKLREAVERYVSDPTEASWVERHLRPLAGLEAKETTGGDRRGEAFAAWRRFLEALAEERPLVLVFEDLHWADDALLDFVDHLVDWASGVPILALCTARPELLVRRSGWGGGKVNASTIRLSPLSEDETATLVHTLVGRSVLAADVQEELLERAGGNPLYAEEFTRMLTERPSEVALPESVQGIIAARLDTLPTEEKELIHDAAVMGTTFWLGALGPDEPMLEERLHSLERKEFVSRERRSSVASEAEYAFRHALVREVAYDQIPRARRAEKHRVAAEWIESLGRPEDHAEMVAYHYSSALRFAEAAGQPTDELAVRARLALGEAGERAFSLNAFPSAARLYSDALGLWPAGDSERARLLFRRAQALHLANDDTAVRALEEARDSLLGAGDSEPAAEAEALLAKTWWFRGQRDRAATHLERAAELIRHAPPSPAKARVLSELARQSMLAAENEEAVRLGNEALAMAEELGLVEVRVNALNTVGMARFMGGEPEGRREVERSLELALATGSSEAIRGYINLGSLHYATGDLRHATELQEAAGRAAAHFGDAVRVHGSRGDLAELEFHAGRWDDARRLADPFIAECEAGLPQYSEVWARTARAMMRMATGDAAGALTDENAALAVGRAAKDPQTLLLALACGAGVCAQLGRREEADALVSEILPNPPSLHAASALSYLSWAALQLRRSDEVRGALDLLRGETLWLDACRAVLDEAFEQAADVFATIGSLPNESYARLRAAEKLLDEGRSEEAKAQLERALAFYRGVGATTYVREAEELGRRFGREIPA